MISTPHISIVIPVYNGSDYFSQAIDSALAQTYPNIEIIVVNDGSNDGGATENIALSYGDKVRYFSKENGGVASALNFAIREMKGEYFSWLSHDDLYYPDKVESQVQTFAGIENTKTILYGDYAVFSNSPDVVSETRLPHVPPERFRYFLTVMNSLHGCTLMVPKCAFEECGLFNEKLRTTQDYDLWFRMAGSYQFVHVPNLLVKARHHAEQGTIKMGSIALVECDELLTGFVERLSDAELEAAMHSSISLAYAHISASMHHRGFFNAARRASSLAVKHLGKGSIWGDLRSGMVLLKARWIDSVLAKVRRLSRGLRRGGNMVRLILKQRPVKDEVTTNTDLKEKFSKIYANNTFGGAKSPSGEGSDLVQTAQVRRMLPKVVQEYHVESFLDAPCGDYYWMRETKLGVKQYIGVDIVEALIAKNQRQFGDSSTTFKCLNLVEDKLPKVDMVFCRDCLVHLNFEDINKVIDNFKKSESMYLLTTTFTKRTKNKNLMGADIWRPLNLQLPPFNFPKPLMLIDEMCTEYYGQFADKHLGLWLLSEIQLQPYNG